MFWFKSKTLLLHELIATVHVRFGAMCKLLVFEQVFEIEKRTTKSVLNWYHLLWQYYIIANFLLKIFRNYSWNWWFIGERPYESFIFPRVMWRWALPVLATGSPLKLCVLAASSAPQRTLPLQPGWPHEPSARQKGPWPHCSQQWCMLQWGRSGGRLRPSLIAWRYQGSVQCASIATPICLGSNFCFVLFSCTISCVILARLQWAFMFPTCCTQCTSSCAILCLVLPRTHCY